MTKWVDQPHGELAHRQQKHERQGHRHARRAAASNYPPPSADQDSDQRENQDGDRAEVGAARVGERPTEEPFTPRGRQPNSCFKTSWPRSITNYPTWQRPTGTSCIGGLHEPTPRGGRLRVRRPRASGELFDSPAIAVTRVEVSNRVAISAGSVRRMASTGSADPLEERVPAQLRKAGQADHAVSDRDPGFAARAAMLGGGGPRRASAPRPSSRFSSRSEGPDCRPWSRRQLSRRTT